MAVLLGIFLYGVGYGVFMTSIPNYMSSFVFSNHNLSGLTFIAFYVGITLAQFIGGPIADNRGRLLPMLGGLCLYSICMLLFFHASTFFSLLILFVAGFGLGLFLVGSIPFLNDQAGLHSKGFTSGLFYFFWGGGYFLGPIILGYTGKYNYYPIGFSAIGISGIVVTFLIIFTCRRSYSKKN
jgi:MFS family permease